MLATNHTEGILNDGKLDDTKSDYLVAFQDNFLTIRRGAFFLCGALQPPLVRPTVWLL